MELLRQNAIDVSGMEAVVVGRSVVLGKPLALLLLQANATVTICHTRTRDRAAICRRADLLCAASGRPGLISDDMIKPGAVVLDFGTSPGPDGGLVGDVDFDAAKEVAGWITPVPGGTGAVTTAVLLRNTLEAARDLTG
jgi:methylenetetrahydrofolate dehydrogenase (NADP+)/methenyltetrahydrofolate cyclohydrolase